MDSLNGSVFTEIMEILEHTDKDITDKIPEHLKVFFMENMDKEYKPNINFYKDDWEITIQEDTKSILALIYRDYIVPEDERKALIKEEQEEKMKQEKELREKYNPDNLFKNKTDLIQEGKSLSNTQLIEVKESSWYKKIWVKILKFFHIKE